MRFKKKTVPAEKRETHGAKWFECRQCGKRWRMWLEKGVEDKRFGEFTRRNINPCPIQLNAIVEDPPNMWIGRKI